MLAMISAIVLQACHGSPAPGTLKSPELHYTDGTPMALSPKTFGGIDYFSVLRSNTGPVSPISPTWPRPPSSTAILPLGPSLSSSNSSRGSWSSLFGTSSVRQFMSGVQDTLKDGLTTPSEIPPSVSGASGASIPVPKGGRVYRGPDSPLPRRRSTWRDPSLHSPTVVSKSWNEVLPLSGKLAISFSSAGHRQSAFSRMNTPQDAIHEKRVIVVDFEGPETARSVDSFLLVLMHYLACFRPSEIFSVHLMEQFVYHVQAYAEILFRWKLYHKRLELLKSVNRGELSRDSDQHGIGGLMTLTISAVLV